jgi:hypothetical protein
MPATWARLYGDVDQGGVGCVFVDNLPEGQEISNDLFGTLAACDIITSAKEDNTLRRGIPAQDILLEMD